MAELDAADWQLRHYLINELAATGRAPLPEDAALELGLRAADVRAAFQRLHDAHLLVLDDAGRLLMMHPFSNVATGFRCLSGGVGYDANCAWDAFGIAVALHRDGVITARIPGEQGQFRCQVRGGMLEAEAAVVHFPLPLRQWYDDLVYT